MQWSVRRLRDLRPADTQTTCCVSVESEQFVQWVPKVIWQQVPDSEVPVRQNEFKEMVGDLEAGGQFIEDHSEQAHGKYICRIT
jgi:hypothetical protein